jgi:hypothetical protein
MAVGRRFGRVRKLPSGRWQARLRTADGRDHPSPGPWPHLGLAHVRVTLAQGDAPAPCRRPRLARWGAGSVAATSAPPRPRSPVRACSADRRAEERWPCRRLQTPWPWVGGTRDFKNSCHRARAHRTYANHTNSGTATDRAPFFHAQSHPYVAGPVPTSGAPANTRCDWRSGLNPSGQRPVSPDRRTPSRPT